MSVTGDQPPERDLKREVAIGAVWSALGRWGVRSLGLVSTLVLARLLMPEDFGLIAMASAVYAVISSLGSLGIQTTLVSLRDLEERHFATAWTLSLLTGAAIAAVLLLCAPTISGYYNEARVEPILRWMALGALVSHAASPKLALLLKRMEFNRDFQYLLLSKLLAVAVSILAALWLRDYRALVIGNVASSVISAALSYAFSPWVPRFDLSARREILGFSLWLLLRNLSFTGMNKLEQAVIGPFFGPTVLSYYYMGSELSNILTAEVGQPLGRALLPGYALVRDQKERLRNGLRMSFAAMLLVMPLGFGLAALAEPVIGLLLGEKWLPAAPLFALMSIAGSLRVIRSPFGPLFLATGLVRAIALITFCGAVLLVSGAWALAHLEILELIALLQIAVRTGLFIAVLFLARVACGIDVRAIMTMLLRVLLACLVMYLCVDYLSDRLALPVFVRIAVIAPLGALTFLGATTLLWRLAGRPFGPEDLVLHALGKLAAAARKRRSK